MEREIVSCKDYTILRVGTEKMREMVSFVVTENYIHHSHTPYNKIIQSEIEDIYQEELLYCKDSEYFVVRDKMNKMVGCIRVFKWDKQTPTPMHKIFQICPLEKVSNKPYASFWHVGRFAIGATIGFSTVTLFKQLMVLAIEPILQEEESYMIAETDSHLLRVMNALGIGTKQIGSPLLYLASETLPILSSKEGLIEFYKRYHPLLVAS